MTLVSLMRLTEIIRNWQANVGRRSIIEVQRRHLLPGAVFAGEPLDSGIIPARRRELWRRRWFARAEKKLRGCNMVFIDPDNSLCHPARFDYAERDDWQRLPLNEANQLCGGRPAVIYHHPNREAGMQHRDQILNWMEQIPGCTHAFLVRRWNARAFFAINFDGLMLRRLNEFVERWRAVERNAGFRPAELSSLIH